MAEHFNWCICKEHRSKSFVKLTDCYSRTFIPERYALYTGGDLHHEVPERTLYLYGRCSVCGGFMRSGRSLPINLTGGVLLEFIYHSMRNYQPFGNGVKERMAWYERQQKLSQNECDGQFLRLFRAEDLPFVTAWIKNIRS